MTAPTSHTVAGLPAGWPRRSVMDPEVFGPVVDLIVLESWRATGALVLLLCHADGRLIQSVALDELNSAVAATTVERVLAGRLSELSAGGVPAAVVVIARPGPAERTDRDHDLCDAFGRACSAGGIELLGVALAVPGAVIALVGTSTTEAA